MVSKFYHFISGKALLVLLLFVGAIGTAFAEIKVQVGNISTAPGQTVTVPVILESDEVIRDIQLDIKATNGYTISNIQKQGLPNHSIASNVLSSTGATRVMVTSNSASTISAGSRTLLTVDVTSNSNIAGSLSVTNIVASLNNSSVVKPANVTANISPIYDKANVVVSNASANSGASFSIPVRLNSSFNVRDVQMDIFVPSAISNVKISNAIGSHTLDYQKLNDNLYRVVIASVDGNSIAANSNAILFYLNGTAPRGITGSYNIDFYNIVSSKSNTETVDGDEATVTLNVTKQVTPGIWTEPAVPAFEPMATDGETVQYLYNVEAKSFFLGANDWGTRASVSKTKGYQVKMTPTEECWDGYGHKQHWGIYNFVETFGRWYFMAAEGATAWVDGSGRENSENWVVVPQDNNMYKIYNCGIYNGDDSRALGLAEIFEGKKGNTRLWIYDPTVTYWNEEVGDEASTFQGAFYDKWAFVSPAEYEAYIAQSVVYEAAMKLQEALEEAKAEFPGANFADAEAVFNNTSSSVEELDEARIVLVPLAISKYQAEHVSADDPQDMTKMVPNYDFENGYDGWMTSSYSQNFGLATNKTNNYDYPGTTMTGRFLEKWHYDTYSGNIYTVLNNMPSGLYKIEMDAFANYGKDTWVYANDTKTRTNGVDSYGNTGLEMGDTPYRFSVYTVVGEEGYLELGLSNASECCNWIGIDNVSLLYYGDGDDAYKLWYQKERASIISTMDALVTPETKYDKNQKNNFNAALAMGDNATSKDSIIAAISNLKYASDAVIASIAAYAELEAKVEEYQYDDTEYDEEKVYGFFRNLIDATDVSGGQAALDSLKEALDAEGETSPIEVSPIEILEKCTYSTEYVLAYIPAFKALHDICASLSIGGGTDITNMLVNPKFTDPYGNGWIREYGSITWRGGFYAFPVAESYHSAFDFYQEVTVPNGIYSLSLNGFCRPDDGETEPAAEIYMNDYATKFQTLAGGALPTYEAVDGFNCYLSNGSYGAYHSNPIFAENDAHSSPADNLDRDNGDGYIPDGMEGASIAFSANRYQAKVYGMVENGKIRLGARCSSTHQWVLWGNFTLKYEGESDEAMMALAESYASAAQQYLDENIDNMSEPAAEALAESIDAVYNGETAEEIKAALKTMNAALEDAKANVAAVHEFMKAQEEMYDAAECYGEMASSEAIETFEELAGVEYYELTTAQIIEYTTKFNDCAAMLRIPDPNYASDYNPIDFSQVIINPDFEADYYNYDGWTLVKKDGASGNYQPQYGFEGSRSMEFWSGTNGSGTKFDFYQDITNLPAGTYELTVDAANSLNGQYQENYGRAYIYAAKGANKFNYVNANPIEIQEEGCQDMYGNYSVIVNLKEGETLRIGATNVGDLAARWVMVDNFRLIYYGKNSSKVESAGKEVQRELSGDYDPNDFTYLIANADFDEDLTFQADGSTKNIVEYGSLSNRSHMHVAADGTVYASAKTYAEGNGNWKRTDVDHAINGFGGQIAGWTLNTGSASEWTYFGSVPYDVEPMAIPIADDNNGSFLTMPQAPDSTENKAALYLRAGWGNYAEYSQVVSLPCAQYRLEYWINNMNYASTDASGLENRCEIICRKDHFKDDAGINANGWEKHTIEFTPTAEFTIKMGFKAGNYGSGKNPILLIDGLKLTKIGEADRSELLIADLNDLVDQLMTMAEEQFSDASAIQMEIENAIDDIYDAITDEDVYAMQSCYNEKSAYISKLNYVYDQIQEMSYNLDEAMELLETTEYAGLDDFMNAVEETTEYIDNGYESLIPGISASDYVGIALDNLINAIYTYVNQPGNPIVASPSFSIYNGDTFSVGSLPSFYVHFNDIRNIDYYTDAIVYAELYQDTTLVSTASTWNYLGGYHYFYFDGVDTLSAGNYTLKVTQVELVEYGDTINVDYSVNFHVTEPYKLNIELAEGWNWISVNAPTYVGIWDITYQTDSKVDYVADQLNDASFSYNNYDWYGNLWDINCYTSYKVHATDDCTLRITYPNKSWWTDRDMNPGWNWLSYNVAYPQMVSEAMAYYEPTDGDIIKSFDNTAVYSSEEGWIGDFVMNPGEGYLYKSESIYNNYFEYNWGEEVGAEIRTAPRKSYTALTYNPHLYRDNMAVIATVGDDTFGNFSVAAMVGDECRGISKLAGDFQFVTVHGEKRGEEITFYLIDNISGNIYLANETVSFNGSSMGTLNSPVTLTVGALIGDTETGIKGAQIAGANDDVYTINGVKVKDANAKGIYIKNGNKVIVK